MAYNSDGYIMLDFTEVDFRRTNQTIDGLFKRCVDVIGTNKFILVINANGRTPLPATCSFTNNQYVIDTCIYMFAISSNDNLFIRRNDVPASDIIDDSSISVDKTWSSNKIDSELDTKADASALADYQPLLTAGDNITISNNVISSRGIKHFTYTGNDETTVVITFPEVPLMVLKISGGNNNVYSNLLPFYYGERNTVVASGARSMTGTVTNRFNFMTYNENVMTMEAESAHRACNGDGIVYTVYYI